MQVKKMNSDVIADILNKKGIDGLIKAVHQYVSACYERAYRDGYIHGQGIGYQDGKYNGYCQCLKQIMKAK